MSPLKKGKERLRVGQKPRKTGIFYGVIVGSSLKVAGYTWNPVDPKRVERFMELVMEIRKP